MKAEWTAENLSLLDLRRIRQGIRRGWDVPEDVRLAIIDAIGAKMDSETLRAREIISLGKTLLLADGGDISESERR